MTAIQHDLQQLHDYPAFQVYTRPGAAGGWKQEITWRRWVVDDVGRIDDRMSQRARPGLYIESIDRALLPSFSTATLWLPFGTINERQYSLDGWDIDGHQIRIDAQDDKLDWHTVFWGVVERHEDFTPGGALPEATYGGRQRSAAITGTRVYHCTDLLYQLTRRYLTEHYYSSPDFASPSGPYQGAVGYNVDPRGRRGHAAANRGEEMLAYNERPIYAHTLPGSGAVWTDRQALDHALYVSRLPGDQAIDISDPADLLSTTGAWPISHGMTTFALLSAICRRQRGLGSARATWDLTTPDRPIYYLEILPQSADDITVPAIADGDLAPITISGASTTGTDQQLVLTGDHRLVDGSVDASLDREHTAGYVESLGEQIRVLLTLGPELVDGWSASEESAYEAAAAAGKDNDRFLAVYRMKSLDADWSFITRGGGYDGVENVSTVLRCDYRLNDAGAILNPNQDGSLPRSESPLGARIMPECPCLIGQSLQTGAIIDTDQAQRARLLPIGVYIRTAENEYERLQKTGARAAYQPRVMGNNILILPTKDEGATRKSQEWIDDIHVRCGLELQARVRLATGDPADGRKQLVRMPGVHLWLGHVGALVDLDETDGATPVRIPEQQQPIIYRDDRALMAARHALACAWYLAERRTLRFELDFCCGLVPDFGDLTDERRPYPRLGYVTTTADIDGEEVTINSVCSRVSYARGSTTYQHSWSELDI